MNVESCLGHDTLDLRALSNALDIDSSGRTQPPLLRLPTEIRLEIY